MSKRARRRRLRRAVSGILFACSFLLWSWNAPLAANPEPTPGPHPAPRIDRDHLLASIDSAMVRVIARGNGATARGAGVIVSAEGFIATADHVIGTARDLTVITADGREHKAERVVRDVPGDLALLKIHPDDTLTPVSLAQNAESAEGRSLLVVGNPHGKGQRLSRAEGGGKRAVVWDAGKRAGVLPTFRGAVHHGHSGGGAFDADTGELLGIVVAKSTTRENLGYFVPVEHLVAFFDRKLLEFEICESRRINRRLGVWLRPVRLLDNPKHERGMLITSVTPGGLADRAGMKAGDILVGLGDYRTPDQDAVLFVLDRKEDLVGTKFLCVRGDDLATGRFTPPTERALDRQSLAVAAR
jgi:S1-C subfamily serine protease